MRTGPSNDGQDGACEAVTALRISIDLEDDEVVLLIRLLLQHVIEFQEGDWRLLAPFESRLLRKLESVRRDAIKSLNETRDQNEENHNTNGPTRSRTTKRKHSKQSIEPACGSHNVEVFPEDRFSSAKYSDRPSHHSYNDEG